MIEVGNLKGNLNIHGNANGWIVCSYNKLTKLVNIGSFDDPRSRTGSWITLKADESIGILDGGNNVPDTPIAWYTADVVDCKPSIK